MCHLKATVKKPELTVSSKTSSQLGKRSLHSEHYNSELSELMPLTKVLNETIEEKFEFTVQHSTLIDLVRNPASSYSEIENHLDQHFEEIDAADSLFQCTPLHYAAFYNKNDIIKLLCEKGANLNPLNSQGFTPILWAAEKNFTSTVKLLASLGADITATDSQRFTLLHKSVLHSNTDLVSFLLSQKNEEGELILDINATSEEGFTPLHQAALHGCHQIIKLLIKEGANVNSITKHNKATPLHLSVYKNNVECTELLLNNGALINAQDRSLRTPLHYACMFGHFSSIRSLLPFKPDLYIKDRKKETPLSLAIKSHDPDLLSSTELLRKQ